MGRLTPDYFACHGRVAVLEPGPPTVAKCGYCGRYGSARTQCEGCGATVETTRRSSRPLPKIEMDKVWR